MKKQPDNMNILISGGGTGGHIFPAISIADELRRRYPQAEILFVGAKKRMEMERVPAAGYNIIGLPITGFQRKLSFRNILVLWNLLISVIKAGKIVREFKPVIAIGVGGYASGPVLRSAARMGIPTLLQEQNSYAGVTNKLLAKRATRICVAYSHMDRFFPKEKIVLTGNPVRNFMISEVLKQEGLDYFKLNNQLPVLLVIGGSLGARTINEAMLQGIEKIANGKVQVIWQTGKLYFESVLQKLSSAGYSNIHVVDFITRMDLAYNVADLLISRAGAISISEICATGKASVLVPSPNVAEDHQTKNAMALVEEHAAVMVSDKNAREELLDTALDIIARPDVCSQLSSNSKRLAKPDATIRIVDEITNILNI